MAEIDPGEMTANEIKEVAERATTEEKAEAAAEERQGKNRRTVLEALGEQPDAPGVRRSGTGRILGDQEADPKVAAKATIAAQLAHRAEVEAS